MKHCSNCGAPVEEVSKTKYSCKQCETDHYVNPKAATTAFILTHNNKLVLAKRAHEPYKGQLDCLGGFLDVGENFEEALLRELHEESGITEKDIKTMHYLCSAYDDYPWNDAVVPVTAACYVIRLHAGVRLVANDDVETIKEATLDDLPQRPFAWDGMNEAFQKFKRQLQDTA